MFNLIQKWNFPSNNYGQIFGIADSGVETFKGTPIKSLAREICQKLSWTLRLKMENLPASNSKPLKSTLIKFPTTAI